MVKFSVLIAAILGIAALPSSVWAGGGDTELYSWRDTKGNWMFILLPGTNFQKNEKDIKEDKDAVKGVDALKKALAKLPKGEKVNWGSHRIPNFAFAFPEEVIIKDIMKAAKAAKIELTLDRE